MDEQQALERFLLTGNEEPFCALFEAYFPRVRRYFLLRGLDRMGAEDLAQNVMFHVYRHALELRDRALFNGWLFKIARNELLQHWRRQDPPEWMVPLEPLSEVLSEELVVFGGIEGGSQFAELLAHLEPAERELLRLRFVDELTYEELAVALGLPLGTVKWRLFNARKKISQSMVESNEAATPRKVRMKKAPERI